MKLKRKLIALAAIAGLAMPLAACGNSESSDQIKLSYFSWNNTELMTPLVQAFEQKNPDVKIDLSNAQGAANDYVQTLTTRIAGDQLPDIYHISTATRHDIITGGFALDLTGEPFMEGLDPTGVAFYTEDGRQYGLTPTVWIGCIVYNKELLKKAGYDTVPETLPEFIEMGKKLKDLGITPYMEDPTVISGSFLPMLGGYYFKKGDPTGDSEIFNNETTFEEEFTPRIEEWKQLVDEGVIPREMVGVSGDQVSQAFFSGELAMFRSGFWDEDNIRASGIDFGTAPFPALSDGEPLVGGGPDSPFAINAKLEGDKLDAAKRFLSFVNSEEGLKHLHDAGWLSTSANYTPDVSPEFKDLYDNYISKGKYYWLNWPANGSVMEQTMTSQFQLLIQGGATPTDVTKALDDAWQKQ